MSTKGTEEFQGTDRFGILRRIGAGGMGIVYEAYDRESEESVALKVLRNVAAESILRFKQEFRSLAQTVHPNLVPLYELFSDGNQWFFTMELLEDAVGFVEYVREGRADESPPGTSDISSDLTIGSSQDSAGKDVGGSVGRDPDTARESDPVVAHIPAERTRISGVDFARLRDGLRQLVEGTKWLHDAGIVHRDLKPENVLVRTDGRVTLLDFGLVADLKGEESILPAGSSTSGSDPGYGQSTERRIVGSIGYMSPEQAAAQPLTPATDWYAVGVILYRALTGRLPFEGRASDVLDAKQRIDPPAPSSLFEGVPEEFDELCMRLMDRDPAKRPDANAILLGIGAAPDSGDAQGAAEATPAIPVLPFVGRREQLAFLTGAFERVTRGATGICRVYGRSGVGKSTLIEHCLRGLRERNDVVVLSGRCYEQESVPYKAVDTLIDAVTHFLLGRSPSELESLVPPRIDALARIFPVLTRVPAIEAAPDGAAGTNDLQELRRQAFEALRELLARIGKRHPLVLHVDDLQWGDVDSGELFRELLRHRDPPRLLMLFSYRTEYVRTSACLQALENLAGHAEASFFDERMELEALTEAETRALTRELIGGDTSASEQEQWVVKESGGSALFVYELVQRVKSGKDRSEFEGLHLDEILWQRIQQLPEQARGLLEVVAVAGGPIRLRHALDATGHHSIPPYVIGALRAEHLLRSTGPRLDDDMETYHDRIRESIVDHLSGEKQRTLHRALAESLSRADDTPPEMLAVHLEGAGEATQAGAHYEAAADLATRALAFGRAEDFYRRALALAPDGKARAHIYEKLVHYYTDLARFEDAYRAGIEGARRYGVSLPAKFNPGSLVVDLIEARLRIGFRDVAQIRDLKTMSDERLTGGIRMIAALAKAAYQIRPELCVAVNARMVNLCLKHGNTADAAIGYMVFGSIFLGGVLGKYKRGYEFGKLALDLVEKYENVKQRAEVNFVVGYFGTSWLRPAPEAEELWSIARKSGLETGDLFHTGCACCATTLSYFMRGIPTDRIMAESEESLAVLSKIGLREPAGAVTAVRQAIRNLRAETESRASFSSGDFDEATYVKELEGYGSRHFAHYYSICRMQALYLQGESELALAAAESSAKYLSESKGMLHSAEHDFYHALILLELRMQGSPVPRSSGRTIAAAHKRLRKWSALCPANFLHKERLVAGERARLAGADDRALQFLEEAIDAAREHGYLHLEGVGHRLKAKLSRDPKEHLQHARNIFRKWGVSEDLARH